MLRRRWGRVAIWWGRWATISCYAKSPQTVGNVAVYSAKQVSSNFFFESLFRVW